jgi:myo-inositol-1(or 4)-monophosphatase
MEDSMVLAKELAVATQLALEAGNLLRRYRETRLDVGYRNFGEPVTVADLLADDLICSGLASEFPEDWICSEEIRDEPDRLTCNRVWMVDALNSTGNFVDHGDEFCVSIGLTVRGEPVLGVIYNPVRDELFAGAIDCGVSLNGYSVKASGITLLRNARVTVSSEEWRRGFRQFGEAPLFYPVPSSAYRLGRVAAGIDDASVSLMSGREWTTCAGAALIVAAGGVVCNKDRTPLTYNSPELRHPDGFGASGKALSDSVLTSLATEFGPTLRYAA